MSDFDATPARSERSHAPPSRRRRWEELLESAQTASPDIVEQELDDLGVDPDSLASAPGMAARIRDHLTLDEIRGRLDRPTGTPGSTVPISTTTSSPSWVFIAASLLPVIVATGIATWLVFG